MKLLVELLTIWDLLKGDIMSYERLTFDILKDKTLKEIEIGEDFVFFTTTDDDCFSLYHSQDCCEYVSIYDTIGDVENILNAEILHCDESNDEPIDNFQYTNDSHTWSIYTITTEKGTFVIRFLGESNGYYSERVYFVRSHMRY